MSNQTRALFYPIGDAFVRQLPTLASSSLVRDVDDLELLGVERWFGAEREFAEIALLHFDDELFVFGAEAFQHGRMDDDAQLEVRFVARSVS